MPKRKRPPKHDRPAPELARPRGAEASAHMVAQAARLAWDAYKRANWTEAERLSQLILSVMPHHPEALQLLGIISAQTGRSAEAVGLLSMAVFANPRSAEAHTNLGQVLHGLARYEEALASYNRALAIEPRNADILNKRGVALTDLKRGDEALESHDRALAIRPDDADALYNRGNALRDLKRFEEALDTYERALRMRPLDADSLNNRGNALLDLRRPEEALQSFERALAVNPNDPNALLNRGNVLCDLGRHGEALASYDRALEIDPDHASGHWNRSLCRLQLGDFVRGWPEYEWRWKEHQVGRLRRDFAPPLWLGVEPLDGKVILLHAEQGFGDTLQFCRYAKRVAALGAKVVLEVQPPLLELLQGLDGAWQVLPKGAPLPAFDCHCPLLSLPLAFKSDASSIPADIPYIRTDASRARVWQDRLGDPSKARIGLAWSGAAADKNDHNRSIALAQMLTVLTDTAEWVSLQKEVRAEDAEVLASRVALRHFGDNLGDFADTAALVDLMDLVVTVDTSVAHLAGAMGKEVWILLPFNPDWRWLLGRVDTAWYPAARLFRQPRRGDWTSVLDGVRDEIGQRLGKNRRATPSTRLPRAI